MKKANSAPEKPVFKPTGKYVYPYGWESRRVESKPENALTEKEKRLLDKNPVLRVAGKMLKEQAKKEMKKGRRPSTSQTSAEVVR